jgi:hypothetical protein
MSLKRYLSLAAVAMVSHAASGAFAVVSPSAAQALRSSPPSEARTAAIKAADRQLDHAPRSMRSIHTEGLLPHQGIRDASIEAERDFPAARELALAYALTGDSRYAMAASHIIGAWLDVYRPDFNPIDETNIDALLEAYDLLPADAMAPMSVAFDNFARNLAKGYLDRMPGVHGGTATNNWQSHRVKLATLSAYESGDDKLIGRARQVFVKQLRDNLLPNGEVLDFEQRDAIHYVVYDLEPLITAALAAKMHGEDWYGLATRSGAALRRSLDWLAPFADGSKVHQEFLRSRVRFDFERRDAGVAGFSGEFDPKNARNVFALAARVDARYAALAQKLRAGTTWLDVVWPLS